MNEVLEKFLLKLTEEEASVFHFIEGHLTDNFDLRSRISYGAPFFFNGNKHFCYFNKSKSRIYLGFVMGHRMKHKALESEGRKQIKVYYLPLNKDLDLQELASIVKEGLEIQGKATR